MTLALWLCWLLACGGHTATPCGWACLLCYGASEAAAGFQAAGGSER